MTTYSHSVLHEKNHATERGKVLGIEKSLVEEKKNVDIVRVSRFYKLKL